MIFSKQFLQGQIIATLKNVNTNVVQIVKIYFYKGVFLAGLDSANNVVPCFGRENLLNWKNTLDANLSFSFVNGFTENDISKIATVDQSKTALNRPYTDAWYSYQPANNEYTALTGYIEPVVITAIDDPLLLTTVTYCKYLQNLLKANGIPYKGLEIPQ